MSSRLRFAIAAAANLHILLIDEALSTGDAAFKKRSENKMTQLRRGAGTALIVNHAAQVVEEICARALCLMDDELIGDGLGPQIAHDYRWWSWSITKDKPEKAVQILATCREKWKPAGVRIQRSEGRNVPLPTRSRSMTMHDTEPRSGGGSLSTGSWRGQGLGQGAGKEGLERPALCGPPVTHQRGPAGGRRRPRPVGADVTFCSPLLPVRHGG